MGLSSAGLRCGGRIAFALLVTGTLAGCAHKVATRHFTVAAAPDANWSSPVPLDLVLVRVEALVPVVAALSARQWFESRDQFVRDYPGGIEFRSWEFVPRQVLQVERLPFPDRKGFALFVFADYLSDGAHRLRVDPLKGVRLDLKIDGFEAEAIR